MCMRAGGGAYCKAGEDRPVLCDASQLQQRSPSLQLASDAH
jgi:hypothetical protein